MKTKEILMQAVVVLKPVSTSKSDLEILCKQLGQVVTECCRNNIQVIDVIITLNGKDVIKRIKALKEHEDFSIVITYSPTMIADNKQDYIQLIDDMRDWYNIEVKCFR